MADPIDIDAVRRYAWPYKSYAHRQIVRLCDEIDRLRAWKAEAKLVLAKWDEVWRAAGEPGFLGQSFADATHNEVLRLRAENERMARELWAADSPKDGEQ
jgi:hypothetical protein